MESPDSMEGKTEFCPKCRTSVSIPNQFAPHVYPEQKRKPCRECKQQIDAKATKCPYCRSSQKKEPSSAESAVVIALVGIFLIVVYVFTSIDSQRSEDKMDRTYERTLENYDRGYERQKEDRQRSKDDLHRRYADTIEEMSPEERRELDAIGEKHDREMEESYWEGRQGLEKINRNR